jgi:hypothetical protein
MAQEPSSHSQRVEIRAAKIFILPSPRRLFLDTRKQWLEP